MRLRMGPMGLLVLPWLLLSASAQAAARPPLSPALHKNCAASVDPSKIVLFFNINQAYSEVSVAKEAVACRGETLKVIPDLPSEAVQEQVHQATIVNFDAQTKVDSCYKKRGQDNPECVALDKGLDPLHAQYAQMLKNLNITPTTDDNIYDLMDKIADEGKQITGIILSGHSGGGDFSGDGEDDLDRADLFRALQGSFKDYPNLIGTLKTVLLWGCYGWTNDEVEAWKNTLPQVRLIAGFSHGGPSSLRPMDMDLMRAMIDGQEDLMNATTVQGFQAVIRGIYASGSSTSIATYVRSPLGNEFQAINEGWTKPVVATPYVTNLPCLKLQPQIANERNVLKEYLSGEKALPVETGSGELRELYSFVRINTSCITDPELTADHVGNLLFFNGVKRNFGFSDHATIEEAALDISTLQDYMGLQISANTAFASLVSSVQENFWPPTADGIAGRTRVDVIAETQSLMTLVNTAPTTVPASIFKLAHDMKSYLVDLDPKCMGFLDWHEYNGIHEPEMKCDNSPHR